MRCFLAVFLALFLLTKVNGQNLHSQSNAASILDESGTTTGWMGTAQITSSAETLFQGNFSIRVASTATNGRMCAYTFTAVIGQSYDISIWARAGTQNFQPAFANWTGFQGFATTVINGLNWTQYNWTVTATATAPIIRIYTSPNSGGTTGDTVFFDSVSILQAGSADSQPPSAVTTLFSSNTTSNGTTLNWQPSTDNVGVTGYDIFQNGTQIGSSANTNFQVTGLTPTTTYTFTAFARDVAGNFSTQGNTANVTTQQGGFTDYTSLNANLSTVDWRGRDLFAIRNVGIGTTNTQGHRLAVAGSIVAEEIRVELQSNWPDYVFENGYDLPTLEDIQETIKTNGRLPGIPSASEVEINGILVGDMISKLLQKIEELTLYTIEQENRLNKLERDK
ncbi:MAG: hypothetical protein KJO53_08800 [Eudoraea sp.]|nr:hypothetical protein [Eudoraea sp.]